jgi:hypothetical protein
VVKAQLTLDRIASEVTVVEGELHEAEIELHLAEERAAAAGRAGRDRAPLSPIIPLGGGGWSTLFKHE